MMSRDPPIPSTARTLAWLETCEQSLADAEEAATALARRRRAPARDLALLRFRIAALRAEIAEWRARLHRREEEIGPQWMQRPSPWCPPPPEMDD